MKDFLSVLSSIELLVMNMFIKGAVSDFWETLLIFEINPNKHKMHLHLHLWTLLSKATYIAFQGTYFRVDVSLS